MEIDSASDEELMRLVTRDDIRAFEELYTRYARRLQGFFFRMLGYDTAKAEDFTQELFLKVYEQRLHFEHSRTFSSWVFAMAYNLCKNEYRHKEVVEAHEAELNASPAPSVEPEYELYHDRLVFDMKLKENLRKLTSEQIVVFALRYEEEFSIPEIARILSCPEGTVKSRLHYVLKFLSQAMAVYNLKN